MSEKRSSSRPVVVTCECGGKMLVTPIKGTSLWSGRCDACGRSSVGTRPRYRERLFVTHDDDSE